MKHSFKLKMKQKQKGKNRVGVSILHNKLVKDIVKVLDDKFAENVNIVDFERTNPFTDYFIICEVDSSRQIEAIVNEFVKQKKEELIDIRGIDGQADSGWVVVDLFDAIVHIFDKSTRNTYELDKLFLNHPSISINDL